MNPSPSADSSPDAAIDRTVRRSTLAGTWYPGEPAALTQLAQAALDEARRRDPVAELRAAGKKGSRETMKPVRSGERTTRLRWSWSRSHPSGVATSNSSAWTRHGSSANARSPARTAIHQPSRER